MGNSSMHGVQSDTYLEQNTDLHCAASLIQKCLALPPSSAAKKTGTTSTGEILSCGVRIQGRRIADWCRGYFLLS